MISSYAFFGGDFWREKKLDKKAIKAKRTKIKRGLGKKCVKGGRGTASDYFTHIENIALETNGGETHTEKEIKHFEDLFLFNMPKISVCWWVRWRVSYALFVPGPLTIG